MPYLFHEFVPEMLDMITKRDASKKPLARIVARLPVVGGDGYWLGIDYKPKRSSRLSFTSCHQLDRCFQHWIVLDVIDLGRLK